MWRAHDGLPLRRRHISGQHPASIIDVRCTASTQTGYMRTAGWVFDQATGTYYLSSGAQATGWWIPRRGLLRSSTPAPAQMATGWIKDGSHCHLEPRQRVKDGMTGWHYEDGARYYRFPVKASMA